MNFLADESIDRQIVDRLRQDGHAVRYVAEMEPGISDDIVLDLAHQEADVLLTQTRTLASWCSAKVGLRPASCLFDWRVYHQHARQRYLLLPLASMVQSCQVPSPCLRQVLCAFAS